MLMDVLGSGITYFAAALFAHAGLSKWRSPQAYQETVASTLGRAAGIRAVRMIGAAELGSATLMAVPAWRELGLILAAALLVIYAAVMGWQVYRGQVNLRCGCGGPGSDTRIGSELIWRNVVLAGCALWATGYAVPLGVTAMWLALAVALMCVITYAALDQAIENRQRWQRGTAQ